MSRFKIGDSIVYPAHGVGTISSEEKRKIGGAQTSFWVLKMNSGATLMVPAGLEPRSGMRRVSSETELSEAFDVIKQAPRNVGLVQWNRRYREFSDLLRTGSLLDVASVLRDLNAFRASKDLSYGEKKMLDKALSLLAEEIALVRCIPAKEAQTQLVAALGVPA